MNTDIGDAVIGVLESIPTSDKSVLSADNYKSDDFYFGLSETTSTCRVTVPRTTVVIRCISLMDADIVDLRVKCSNEFILGYDLLSAVRRVVCTNNAVEIKIWKVPKIGPTDWKHRWFIQSQSGSAEGRLETTGKFPQLVHPLHKIRTDTLPNWVLSFDVSEIQHSVYEPQKKKPTKNYGISVLDKLHLNRKSRNYFSWSKISASAPITTLASASSVPPLRRAREELCDSLQKPKVLSRAWHSTIHHGEAMAANPEVMEIGVVLFGRSALSARVVRVMNSDSTAHLLEAVGSEFGIAANKSVRLWAVDWDGDVEIDWNAVALTESSYSYVGIPCRVEICRELIVWNVFGNRHEALSPTPSEDDDEYKERALGLKISIVVDAF